MSPVLANLFMHYAFDLWLEREFPSVRFERYADDAVIHCRSLQQATNVLAALENRMAGVGLHLHPDKTRIVYCKDSNRRGSYENTSFTFLGFTFRPRQSQRKDGMRFTAFLPAISKDALRKIGAEVRSWRLHRWVSSDGREIAKLINPKIRGWMAYYGAFYPSALYPVLRRINTYLLRWIMSKYNKHSTWKKAIRVLADAAVDRPRYFAHWAWVKPAAG
nr:reverse transcriptase domain-containing protein [Nocardia coffeae]